MDILKKYRLQETIDCDPSFEACDLGDNEVIERPNGFDLFNLTFTVGALELIAPFLSLTVSILLFPNTQLGWGIIVLMFPAIAFVYPNLLWALLSLIYFVFGDNIFIFNWVDSVLVFVIQYVISMLTPLLFIFFLVLDFVYLFSVPDELGILSIYLIL